MNDYPLRYVRKNDSRIYFAKRIISGVYKIIDPMNPNECETISKYKLVKEFEFQEKVSMGNVRRNNQPIVMAKLA